jgi:Rod binding domain-containing protein
MIAPATPPTASLPPQQVQKIQKAAEDFEAMAIGQLLAPMFETVDHSKTMFGGGDGEAAWRPMMVSALAKQMAAHGGLGLARPVMQQLLHIQEKQHDPH